MSSALTVTMDGTTCRDLDAACYGLNLELDFWENKINLS